MPVIMEATQMAPIVTPTELRTRWCFGLPLINEEHQPMPDDDLTAFIASAVNEVERKLGIFITPRRIKCNPWARGMVEGIDYDLSEPPYDYLIREYNSWGYVQLRHKQVQSVERVALVLPNGQQIVDFPIDWVKLYPKAGQIHIVPYAGSPTIMTVAYASGSGMPLLTGQFGRNVPQALWIDYTAGLKEVPSDIKNVIAKIAAVDVLGIAGDAILAGVASLSTSVDGLSESFSTTASATNATYGAHILQYQKEIDAFFDPKSGGARTKYKGFTMTVM